MARIGAHRRLQRVALCLGLLNALVLAGCGNLVARKYEVSSGKSGDRLEGVPFMLNKLYMKVQRIPGIDGLPDSYVLTPAYLPDPTQRYVLKVDPGWFAGVDWSLTFDDNGGITEASATVTDNLAPTIVAIGKLGSLAASLKSEKHPLTEARTRAAPPATPPDSPLGRIDVTMTRNLRGSRVVLYDADKGQFAWLAHDPAYLQRWHNLVSEVAQLQRHGHAEEGFEYSDLLDYRLLRTALFLFTQAPPAVPPAVQNEANNPDSPVQARAAEIADAVTSFDRAKLQRIQKATLTATGTLFVSYATRPSVKSAIEANQKVLSLVKDALKAIPPEVALLMDLMGMEAKTWQARRIDVINNKIQERLKVLRLQNSSPSGDLSLQKLQDERAIVLGVLEAQRRRRALEKIIVEQKDAGSFKAMSDEIAYLDKVIADAEASLKAAKPEIKGEDPQPAAVFHARRSEKVDKDWVLKQLPDGARPVYVVVVQPVEGSAP